MTPEIDALEKRKIMTRTSFLSMVVLFVIYCMWHVVQTSKANNNELTWLSVFDFIGTVCWVIFVIMGTTISIMVGCVVIGSIISWFWNGCQMPKFKIPNWLIKLNNFLDSSDGGLR